MGAPCRWQCYGAAPMTRCLRRVEPPEVDRIAGRVRLDLFGDDRQRIRGGEGREDVAPLPRRSAREPHVDPAGCVPARRSIGIPVRGHAQERAPAGRGPDLLEQHGTIDGPEQVAPSRQRADRRPDEQLERDEARDGVARQPEQEGATAVGSRRPSRTRTACPAGPPPATGRSRRRSRTRPSRRRTARPRRHPRRRSHRRRP